MGLFDILKTPKRIKADFGAFGKALGGGILDQVSGAVRTPEAIAASQRAADMAKTFMKEYTDWDKEGGLGQASVAASRRDLFRSGAQLGGGRASAMEIASAMNQMKFQGMAMADQTRASLRSAMGMAMGHEIAAAQSLSVSPHINTILSGAAQMEIASMDATATARAAHSQMLGQVAGAVGMAFAPVAGAGLAAAFSDELDFADAWKAQAG